MVPGATVQFWLDTQVPWRLWDRGPNLRPNVGTLKVRLKVRLREGRSEGTWDAQTQGLSQPMPALQPLRLIPCLSSAALSSGLVSLHSIACFLSFIHSLQHHSPPPTAPLLPSRFVGFVCTDLLISSSTNQFLYFSRRRRRGLHCTAHLKDIHRPPATPFSFGRPPPKHHDQRLTEQSDCDCKASSLRLLQRKQSK